MSGFGFSVTELIQAIAKCKDIYDTFTDEYESAPSRIKELVDTCKYLRDILEDFKSILGNVYQQGISFGRKLDECNAFIQKYRSLKEDYLTSIDETTITSNIRQVWEKAWQTGQFAFDGNRARDLKDALSLEIQKLVLFILVFALKRTVPVNQSTSLAHRIPLVGRSHPHEANTFEELFARLQSVRYIYEREMNIAIQQNRAPNLLSLYGELESGWQALCVRAGLIQENGQAPPLQTERLLVAPSQNMNELFVNLGAPSIHSSLQPLHNIQSQPPSSTASSSSHRVSVSSPFSTVSPSSIKNHTPLYQKQPESRRRASSLNLPDPQMPTYIATIILPYQRSERIMRLRHWESHAAGDTHKIAWIGENPAETLEHHIPPNVFPDTLHSCQEDGLHLSFPEAHYIEWKFEDGIPHNQNIFVEYDFLEPGPRQEFQGDIRGKELVETFDFEYLCSRRFTKDNGREAVLQDLKIWQDRHHPYHHSLSFLATAREEKHLEFPFLWFQALAKREANKPTTVCIEFVRRKESGSASSVTPRRQSTIQRVTSWGKPQSPSKESVSSAVKRPSISSEIYGYLPPADIANEFKSFTIKFSTTEETDGFVNIFEHAHSSDSLPPRFQEPSYDVGSSLGIGLAVSPILGPFQSACDAPSPQGSPPDASASSPVVLPTGIFPTGRPSASQYSATQAVAPPISLSSSSPQLPEFDFQTSQRTSYWS